MAAHAEQGEDQVEGGLVAVKCSRIRNSGQGFGLEEDKTPGAHRPSEKIDRELADEIHRCDARTKRKRSAVETVVYRQFPPAALVVSSAVVVAQDGSSQWSGSLRDEQGSPGFDQAQTCSASA